MHSPHRFLHQLPLPCSMFFRWSHLHPKGVLSHLLCLQGWWSHCPLLQMSFPCLSQCWRPQMLLLYLTNTVAVISTNSPPEGTRARALAHDSLCFRSPTIYPAVHPEMCIHVPDTDMDVLTHLMSLGWKLWCQILQECCHPQHLG